MFLNTTCEQALFEFFRRGQMRISSIIQPHDASSLPPCSDSQKKNTAPAHPPDVALSRPVLTRKRHVVVAVFTFIGLHPPRVTKSKGAASPNPAAVPTNPNSIVSSTSAASIPLTRSLLRLPVAAATGHKSRRPMMHHSPRRLQFPLPSLESSPFSLAGSHCTHGGQLTIER